MATPATRLLLVAILALGAAPARALGDDDDHGTEQGNGDGTGGRGTPARARWDDDVAVRLVLGHRKGGNPVARIRVRNQGRRSQAGILVELRTQSETGDVLQSWTVDLGSRRSWSTRVRTSPPPGTTVLVVTTLLDGVPDQDPSDDVARAFLGPTGSPGTTGSAGVGASIFAAQCAACHGTSAGGTASGPGIAGAPFGEISEAIREGEDGMPTFPGLSDSDVRALAAFLKNPSATPVTPPPAPPPPPAGTPPTYAGQLKALLDANCGACHSGANAAAGIRLDTLSTASKNASRSLAAVQAGRMPQGGTLDADSIRLLQDWIAAGTK